MGRFAARVLNLDQSPAIYPVRTIHPVKVPGAAIPAASGPSAWPTIARGERAIPAAASPEPLPTSTTHRGKTRRENSSGKARRRKTSA